MNKEMTKMLSNVDRKRCSNRQRTLMQLLSDSYQDKEGWVARTRLSVPNASSRVRELRAEGFNIECATAVELNKRTSTERQTFYRVRQSSVTKTALERAFKGATKA